MEKYRDFEVELAYVRADYTALWSSEHSRYVGMQMIGETEAGNQYSILGPETNAYNNNPPKQIHLVYLVGEAADVAEDAAELVLVNAKPLQVITSADEDPGEFEVGRSSEAGLLTHTYGSVDDAFASAETVVELDLRTGRHSGVPLETRGALGFYDPITDILDTLALVDKELYCIFTNEYKHVKPCLVNGIRRTILSNVEVPAFDVESLEGYDNPNRADQILD